MQATLVLVGHKGDEHCDHLEQVLLQMGHDDVARLSLEILPDASFTWTPGRELSIGGYELPMSRCSGLYRRPGLPSLDNFDSRFGRFLTAETTDALMGGLEAIGVRWVNAPGALSRSEFKLLQLSAAAELGIAYPPSVVTNNPDGISRVPAVDLVVKPVRYGLLATEPDALVAYTRSVTPDDFVELDGSPVIVQERINAAFHLRVTTIGGEVFIAGLRAGDEVDWRQDPDNHRLFRRDGFPVSDSLVSDAKRLATHLGLGFSAQDWIISESGQFVFVEANPNGQWLFLDPLFDGMLSQRVASLLVQMRDVA